MIKHNVTVTKCFEFAAAHNLNGHKGKCQFIHGHNYKMEITVKSTYNAQLNKHSINDSKSNLGSSYGMVVDFKDLKAVVKEVILNKYDHSFLVWKNETRLTGIRRIDEALKMMKDDGTLSDYNIQMVSYRPTAENMCITFIKDLNRYLKIHNFKFRVVKIRLYESSDSYAECEVVEDNTTNTNDPSSSKDTASSNEEEQ